MGHWYYQRTTATQNDWGKMKAKEMAERYRTTPEADHQNPLALINNQHNQRNTL